MKVLSKLNLYTLLYKLASIQVEAKVVIVLSI